MASQLYGAFLNYNFSSDAIGTVIRNVIQEMLVYIFANDIFDRRDGDHIINAIYTALTKILVEKNIDAANIPYLLMVDKAYSDLNINRSGYIAPKPSKLACCGK
jgi:hypothetical protein